jgi:drug/metabolite transporter (DMT)-like permease
VSVLAAIGLGVAGALLVYLSSPKQNWQARPFVTAARVAGAVALLGAVLLWCRALGVGAGIAAALTTIMFAWVLAPYAGWWFAARRRGEDGR